MLAQRRLERNRGTLVEVFSMWRRVGGISMGLNDVLAERTDEAFARVVGARPGTIIVPRAKEQRSYAASHSEAFQTAMQDDAAHALASSASRNSVSLRRDMTVLLDDDANGHRQCEIPNFKGSYLGRFPLVSADFWTSDHLSERSRSVGAFSGTRARGTLMLKRS